ncbi:tetratricopeptide repeat protein [Constantimarinum furrinae]|uniref:Tetratricopeptide repeat protein n=1 Tax=Constantimarinum furrinae TaxID=2562285 RepID=A0A7G8PWW9_9FLAO|nr:tetratricopeptide repeat protein [Constantimarinum furrinae]QNJ98835.1 Tetratricopeptide repeat protein [Constantimarinum furrinae]
MKKQLWVVGLLMITTITFGQKKEIKRAEKALKSGDVTEAMANINAAESLIGSADSEEKAEFYVLKGEVYLADAGKNDFNKMKEAADAFKKAKELGDSKINDRAKIGVQNLRVALVNSAVEDQKRQDFASASEKLYTSYTIKKDTSDLYFAAGNAVNAKDYGKALQYYEDLLEMGYTGIQQEFVATDINTGEVVVFATEDDRTTNMLSGNYTNPDERMAESVRGDILRNVTLIYISQGENEKALKVMKDARIENPDDTSLIRAEADMAYKMGDMARYNELMKEVVASDPNNPELYYNLGVGSSKNGDNEQAITYYKKAIELDPNYANAKINIAAIILSKEGPIIEQMNNLGTSNADYKKYDELKAQKSQLYKDAKPYLESALMLKPDNVELARTLMNIYSQLGEDEKFKAMKARLAEMEGGQ